MENRYVNNIRKRIGKTIYRQNLIQKGDHILIALSGGKDSLILLESLVDRNKCLPFKFVMTAVHVNIRNVEYKTDMQYLQSFCDDLGVKFILKEFDIDLEPVNKKGMCFICSWNRRKALFELTKELNCNKLAFGHHMDDAIETLFLNMVYHGSISSLPYKFSMFNHRIEVIRPLLELSNNELKQYADLRNFREEIKKCPHDNTSRKELGEFIAGLSKMNKAAKKNIFRSMSNTYTEYLPMYKIY